MIDVDDILNRFNESGLISSTNNHNQKDIIDNELICPHCYSCDIYEDIGVLVCSNCSQLITNIIDNTAEWRYYGIDDSKSSDPNRCGMPTNTLFPNSSLGSIVGQGGGYSMYKIRRFHSWNNGNYKERSLYKVFQDILGNASRHGILLTVVRESNIYYKKISENHISRGSNRSGLISACLFMACKAMSIPRSAKEIAEIFNINTKCVIKGCKRFNEIWARIGESAIIPKEQIKPSCFVERFSCKLKLNHKIIMEAIDIADDLYESNSVCEISPSNTASAILYLLIYKHNIDISKKELCDATNTSLITVNKCYKKIHFLIQRNYETEKNCEDIDSDSSTTRDTYEYADEKITISIPNYKRKMMIKLRN